MATTDSIFDELPAILENRGENEAIQWLIRELLGAKRYHELFEARLLEARVAHGLPVINTQSLDDLPEPARGKMEAAYLAACREVGDLLLAEGKLREAWMYLRPIGERQEMSAAIRASLEKDPTQWEPAIELALHEGIDLPLGFELVLEHYGVCNAITLFDGEMHRACPTDRSEVAGLLVRRVHTDLIANLRADIERHDGARPAGETVEELISGRDWLFAENNYHIDTSHLAAVTRFALSITDPDTLRIARSLTEYGRRLAKLYQFAGHEPFVDIYPHYGLFFEAQLGENVDAALAHFKEHALNASETGEAFPVDVYVALLARLGRYREAIEAAASLLPRGSAGLRLAPSVAELAQAGGELDRMMELCRERNDLVGFATALMARHS